MFRKEGEEKNYQFTPSRFPEEEPDTKKYYMVKILAFFTISTLAIIGVSYLLAVFFFGKVTFSRSWSGYESLASTRTLFISFLIIMIPLGYSIFGLLFLKFKYGKFIGNAKTYVMRALIGISIFALVLHIALLDDHCCTHYLVGLPSMLIFYISIFGLPLVFAVGWWRERDKIHKKFKSSDSKFFEISEIANRLGIKEGSAYKQVNRLLSKNGMKGYITRDKNILVKDSLKDDMISYLKKQSGRSELPLSNIENKFQITEYVAISVIKKLTEERDLGGRIDPLKSVYRYEE